MKIIELRAENVKRLKAVQIEPDGTLQVIGGRNAQGKSSVLDAIWLALGGGKAAKDTPLPIREGEDKARVRLDLGDLVVTRTWTKSGTTLKVENADGAAYKSPQGMLDALVGQLSFDPLAFTRLSAKEQRVALLDLVDLDVDLDALDQQIKATFEDRTRIGREGKAIGDVTVDDTLPTIETTASTLIDQIRTIEAGNRAYDQAWDRTLDAENHIDECDSKVDDLRQQLEEAEKALKEATSAHKTLFAAFTALDSKKSTSGLEEQLEVVEATNAAIRANNVARERLREKEELRALYESATSELQRLETVKLDGLRAAKFPVEGLSFSDDGVTYKGVPLSQASSAEQIRVSLAMGMALNPKLRVLMIKDGSLLDEDSMAAIREQVTEGGYQLWLERVGNADQGAVIITDGQVA